MAWSWWIFFLFSSILNLFVISYQVEGYIYGQNEFNKIRRIKSPKKLPFIIILNSHVTVASVTSSNHGHSWQTNMEFNNEVNKILARHKSSFDKVSVALQAVLTELQALEPHATQTLAPLKSTFLLMKSLCTKIQLNWILLLTIPINTSSYPS